MILGILGLPFAISQMGWYFGLASVVILGVGAAYSGILISRLAAHVQRARNYGDLGFAAYGDTGRRYVLVSTYTFIIGVTIVFHLTCAISLQDVFYESRPCLVSCSAIVAAVMLPISQVRSMHDLSWVAVVGVLCIIVPLVIVVFDIVSKGRVPGVTTALGIEKSFVDVAIGFTNIVFA